MSLPVWQKPKKKKALKPLKINLLEKYEQRAAVQWLLKNNILFYPVTNGRKANMIERMELKRLGVRKGVPDLVIPIARNGYHGLYCELKRVSGGKVSKEQQWWLSALTMQGYYAFVASGADDFISKVKKYLDYDISSFKQK